MMKLLHNSVFIVPRDYFTLAPRAGQVSAHPEQGRRVEWIPVGGPDDRQGTQMSLDGSKMLKVRLLRAPRRERARAVGSPRRVRVIPNGLSVIPAPEPESKDGDSELNSMSGLANMVPNGQLRKGLSMGRRC